MSIWHKPLKRQWVELFFDLPKEPEAQYKTLKSIFLNGSWRNPYKVQQLKKYNKRP